MAEAGAPTIHATCVGLRIDNAWQGVLLRGESGTGKSDVAIRLLESGARLVADDRTALHVAGGQLVARAPSALAGLIEVRGVGVLRLPPDWLLPVAPVCLIVDLAACGAEVDRLPEPQTEILHGLPVPRLRLVAFEASTPGKIRLALSATRAT
jgi:serine kinase of HPr protein (carbohydrate metabolism regulator)